MKKIASFEVDHTRLQPGMYLSRVDGDITTYDLRLRRPNVEPAMEIDSMHTIEHLAATWLRNSACKEKIIYFGPMGCRTGFYLLMRDADAVEAIDAVRKAFAFIAAYEGEIPGVSAAECGNWRSHNLPLARRDAAEYTKVLEHWQAENLQYA
mgnify:CR=1 FL=1